MGLTLSMADYQAAPGGEEWVERIRRPTEDVFLEATGGDDFIGVQTYTRRRMGPGGALPGEEGVPTTQMGYEFWPEALEGTIRRAWEMTGGLPVYVTENGIGTDDDPSRIEYVTRALTGVRRCLDDGIDVRGYFYWSLLDNFEWVLGYGPTFGMVAVDRATFERRPKPSAAWYGGTGPGQRSGEPPVAERAADGWFGSVTARVSPMTSLAVRAEHVWQRRHTPEAKQLIRYTMVSVISTVVSFGVLAIVFGVSTSSRGDREHRVRQRGGHRPLLLPQPEVGVGEGRAVPRDEGDRALLGDVGHRHHGLDRRRRRGPPHRQGSPSEPLPADSGGARWPT